MLLYIDLYFLFNFAMDALALFVCARTLGIHKRRWRIPVAACIGALYSVFGLWLSGVLALALHLCFGALLLLIAFGFGNARRFLRLCLLFFGVCFLLGGAVGALARGITHLHSSTHAHLTIILLCALLGAAVCLFWSGCSRKHPSGVRVCLCCPRGRIEFEGYVDSGNLLQEPLEGTAVILANKALSQKIFSLFADGEPTNDPSDYRSLPLRLVPFESVWGRGMLMALKIKDATVAGEPMGVCIALDLGHQGDYGGFAALVPQSIV